MGVPYVRRIEFSPAPDQLLALRRGEIDLAGIGFEQGVPDAALDPFNYPKYGKVEAPGETTTALHFNLTKGFPPRRQAPPPGRRLRRRPKDLVKRILLGRGVPGSLGGLAPTKHLRGQDLPAYDHDVARASALLDAIGLKDANGDGVRDLPDGSAFRPELLTTPRWNPKTVELVKEYLHEVGIEVPGIEHRRPGLRRGDQRGPQRDRPDRLRRLGGRPGLAPHPPVLEAQAAVIVAGARLRQPPVRRAGRPAAGSGGQGPAVSIVQDMQRIIAEDVPTIPLYLADRDAVFDTTVFDAWYFTPGGVFGEVPRSPEQARVRHRQEDRRLSIVVLVHDDAVVGAPRGGFSP